MPEKTGGRRPFSASNYHQVPNTQQMDDIAAKALEEGQPIPEWRDRATMKTDTILDKLYGMDTEKPEG